MIDAVDKALEKLIKRELSIQNDEIDITFCQPKREWSAQLVQPALNIFLYDVRENVKLRTQSPAWVTHQRNNNKGVKSITQSVQPIPIDLNYLITAWATEPIDEHRLLSHTLSLLYRFPDLPESVLTPELIAQPLLPSVSAARFEDLKESHYLWSSLDNEMKAGIACEVRVFVDPFEPITTPLVGTRRMSVGQSERPATKQYTNPSGVSRFWSVGGTVYSETPLDNLHLTVLEKDLVIPVEANGDFTIGKLRAGTYTLEVSAAGYKPTQHQLVVPAPDNNYDIRL